MKKQEWLLQLTSHSTAISSLLAETLPHYQVVNAIFSCLTQEDIGNVMLSICGYTEHWVKEDIQNKASHPGIFSNRSPLCCPTYFYQLPHFLGMNASMIILWIMITYCIILLIKPCKSRKVGRKSDCLVRKRRMTEVEKLPNLFFVLFANKPTIIHWVFTG